MTEVVNTDSNPIKHLDDLKSRYAGFTDTPDAELRIGAEFEEWYCKPSDCEQGLVLASHDEIFAIKDDVEAAMRAAKSARTGQPPELVSVRPLGKETTSGVLEMSSSAYPNEGLSALYTDYADFLKARYEAANSRGIIVCPTSQVPSTTIQEGWDKMLGDDRKKAILDNFANVLGQDAIRFTFMTSTFQTSLSYRDPDQMYNIIKVSNYLAPFLYILGEDTSGFNENEERMLPYPPHMKYCHALGLYGGISPSFTSSHDADSYLDAHLRMIASMPMFSYFDGEDDHVHSADKFHMPTWEGLREAGLNTGSNFDMAEGGTFWPDVKLCNIRDAHERPIGKRIEIRMADRGFWMIPLSKMIQDTEGNRQIRELLTDYGFDDRPDQGAGQLLLQAQFAALRRGHHFLDIPFGKAGTQSAPRTMHDFAKDLSGVVRDYFAWTDMEPHLSGFHHICDTGMTNARVLQEMYPTLDAAKRYIMEAPAEIVLDMDHCLDQHRENGMMPIAEAESTHYIFGEVGTDEPAANDRDDRDHDGEELQPMPGG